MHNRKKNEWQLALNTQVQEVKIYLLYIVDSDLKKAGKTELFLQIWYCNYSWINLYKWCAVCCHCWWCVCGLMMSLWPEERNWSARISHIHPSAERLIASLLLYFTHDSSASAQTFSPERPWHFHPSSMPSAAVHLTLMHTGQDHTCGSKHERFLLTLEEMCKDMPDTNKHPWITGIGFGYVRNQFIWYNINPQLYVQNKNAVSIAQWECFQFEFIISENIFPVAFLDCIQQILEF